MKDCGKLNGQDKKNISQYRFYILHVYQKIHCLIVLGSHHVSVKQLSLRVKPTTLMVEKTDKKTPQSEKQKQGPHILD